MPFTELMIDGAVATIVFDRDDKRNAFSHAMSEEVLSALDTALERSCRVVILRARPGAIVWCAGHDLTEIDPENDTTRSSDPMLALFERIREIPIPVVTMVEGAVFAGGLILNVVADIAIAAEGVTVAMTANKIGIPFTPEMYAYWLRVLDLHKVKELFFTAAPITADDARVAGIFNHVVSPESLEERTLSIVRNILECSPEGIADTKAQLDRIAGRSSLNREDHARIEEGRRKLLDSPALRDRLRTLLTKLRGGR